MFRARQPRQEDHKCVSLLTYGNTRHYHTSQSYKSFLQNNQEDLTLFKSYFESNEDNKEELLIRYGDNTLNHMKTCMDLNKES